METLPNDIIRVLTTYLSNNNLIAFSLTCSRLYKVCREPSLLSKRPQHEQHERNRSIINYPYITKDGFVKYYSLSVCLYCGEHLRNYHDSGFLCYMRCCICSTDWCITQMTKTSRKSYLCPKCQNN